MTKAPPPRAMQYADLDAIEILLTEAKYLYDQGAFGVLQQGEFFKEMNLALKAAAPAPAPTPEPTPAPTPAPSPTPSPSPAPAPATLGVKK